MTVDTKKRDETFCKHLVSPLDEHVDYIGGNVHLVNFTRSPRSMVTFQCAEREI